jgi:hypothetical protein
MRMRNPVIALALAVCGGGCPTVDLGDAPAAPAACRPDPLYFQDILWAEFLSPASEPARSCVDQAGCHDMGNSARSSFQLQVAPEPIPQAVHDQNYRVTTRFINCGTPEQSSLLTRPLSGTDTHGGGDLFAPGSSPETVFLQWFDTL